MRRRTKLVLAGVSVVVLGTVAVAVAQGPVPGQIIDAVSGSAPPGPGAPPTASTADTELSSRCPWLDAALDRRESPAALARLVLGRMTTDEKLGEIVLSDSGVYENVNAGVPRLCIPPLVLEDGPDGVAFGALHVTQLPAPLGIAATFDTSVARAYGEVEGSEAAGQGIDVLQGPTLNLDRVPEDGRSYEGYGEDPELVSSMGVADIEGIQSTGTMAMAKHFAVYNQETDRGVIDDVVSERALQELYLAPFRAAVTQAHVATVMCAYPQVDGTYTCQDPALLGQLPAWGFDGLVRSDLGSVHNPVAALAAGVDLIKPSSVRQLAALVHEQHLPLPLVDSAVLRILTTLFAHGLVGRADTGAPGTPVDSAAHTAFALTAAERSAVLLKDDHAVLPLATSSLRSLAVIGADAGSAPVTTGNGSSQVTAPFVSTPLAAIRRRAGTGVSVTYADGGSTTGDLPAVPTSLLTPAVGRGHGLTLTLNRDGAVPGTDVVQSIEPTVDATLSPHPTAHPLPPGVASTTPVEHRPRRLRLPTTLPGGGGSLSLGGSLFTPRSHIVLPAGWSDASADWTGTLTPPSTGLYTFSLQGSGAATLTLDGQTAVSDPLSHATGRWSQTVPLVGGHPYRFDLSWEPVDKTTPSGETTVTPSTLTLGFGEVSGQIARAVAAARRSDVAVVFASDYNSEAFDRPSLSLPGDDDALIAAVAAANPRTVVVLNTGGPVLMPWLGAVAGVVEAWYPGEKDGAAIAALLFGDIDPSGRLPVTFPASQELSAVHSLSQWPGVDYTTTFSEGLDIGYRYDHATGVRPLFPFGFGLTYTRFALSRALVHRSPAGATLTVHVRNTGDRSGTDVVQAYLTDPATAGEPPAQLVAFFPVTLAPGERRVVTLAVPRTAFEAFLAGAWTTVPGRYTLSVGQSSSDLPLSVSLTAP